LKIPIVSQQDREEAAARLALSHHRPILDSFGLNSAIVCTDSSLPQVIILSAVSSG